MPLLNYEKAFVRNPENKNAKEQIAKLKKELPK